MATLHSAPRFTLLDGLKDALSVALGDHLIGAHEAHGELVLTVKRESIEPALRILRDDHQYQQLMEIAGVDYPSRAERFEVVYMLLSITRNSRVIVKLSTTESLPVPTVTTLWPNADWLEREVFDLYGVLFDGHPDLRRILTDYGFEGFPLRKDFPLTGYLEVRYSEELKRVVYEPVELTQDLRQFDFMSPWEGADYVLPGDEKASAAPPPAPPSSPPAPAPASSPAEKPKAEKAEAKEGGVDAKPATEKPAAKKAVAKKPAVKKAAAEKKPATAKKPAAKKPTKKKEGQ